MATTVLPKRPLGTTGLEITTVGFGAWAAGGGGWKYSWGPQDDETSIATIRHAVALGVNWIDTAAVYGLGHSEEVVGRALKEIPQGHQPFVFTKCGLIFDQSKPYEEAQRNLDPKLIRRDLESSLRRLRVERIDLYQIHWPDDTGIPVEESWSEMARLVKEGKIRAAGVSNFSVELLERCERIRHVDSLQPPFSLIRRDAGADVIPWCAAHHTGVIVYSPMQSGLLTDDFGPERIARFSEDDWRRRSPEFQSPNLEQNLSLRDALRPIAKRHGVSVSAIAAAWAASWPGVTGAIVGGRSIEQVNGWISAATLTLDDRDFEEISQAIRATSAGSGPAKPTRARVAGR
ncbi:MAG TPA: aldo/keto reductase [Candidatus Acidoferrales bacterium]|nr:aldo/keto reductase [Candidatus Acidoferrales bacterium]